MFLSLYIVCSYCFCETLAGANIGVFWNLDDSPIPDGLDPTTLLEYIKSALENIGYLGRLIQFRAYSKDRSELDSFCEAAGIHLRDRGELHFFSFSGLYIYIS